MKTPITDEAYDRNAAKEYLLIQYRLGSSLQRNQLVAVVRQLLNGYPSSLVDEFGHCNVDFLLKEYSELAVLLSGIS